MISNLYIENIAVIEKTNIDFKNGLNVLTGETGAGKSILIDAINAVLGKRTPKEIIRTGADFAFVSAEFCDFNKETKNALQSLGIEETDSLILERSLNINGKNNCKINGRPVHVSQLKEVSHLLINIHGQNESLGLTDPLKHIDYIDSYCKNEDLLQEYKTAFKEYKELNKKLNELNTDDTLRLQKIDLLQYQAEELEMADLIPGEWEQLNDERVVLLNAEKILDSFLEAENELKGNEDFSGACDSVQNAAESMLTAAKYLEDIQPLADRLYDLSYELKDCLEEVSSQKEYIDGDPGRLDEIEERLDLISKLSKKYGATIEDMLEFLSRTQEQLKELENYDINREQLQKQTTKAQEKAKKLAEKLSAKRKKGIEAFQKMIKQELLFIDMPKVNLFISQEETALYEKGADSVEILISANPGEPPKPMSKIASGGELSRIMLAIKTVLSKSDSVSTLIFDEIDTGISGSAAHKVGKKLSEVSVNTQVICVTHQSQIASFADSHFLIKKEFLNNKTYTSVKELDASGRKNELARIISGSQINDSALNFAEELLKESGKL